MDKVFIIQTIIIVILTFVIFFLIKYNKTILLINKKTGFY